MVKNIRPSAIAGSWYPAQEEKLRHEILGFIERAKIPEINSQVLGLIAPHAGYVYSGATAGYAYKAVQKHQYDLVVVLSPYHDNPPAALLTSSFDAYQTPLGDIAIDHTSVNMVTRYLESRGEAGLYAIGLETEHSLEIELPFLQVSLADDFKLLPVMIASHDLGLVNKLGQGLAKVLSGRNALLVASTDLSHFYPQETAEIYDREMLRQIKNFSPMGVVQAQEQGKGFACGVMAVSAVMTASKLLGATRVEILDYRTSGEVNGDYKSVVGYGAGVIMK